MLDLYIFLLHGESSTVAEGVRNPEVANDDSVPPASAVSVISGFHAARHFCGITHLSQCLPTTLALDGPLWHPRGGEGRTTMTVSSVRTKIWTDRIMLAQVTSHSEAVLMSEYIPTGQTIHNFNPN